MRTSDSGLSSRTASGLHMVSHMKRFAVAILAMVVITGCGVGADEVYDGQNFVAANGQALQQGPEVGPGLPGAGGPQTPETTAPSPGRDPGVVALPQDPIPVRDGNKPVPQGTPLIDPMFDPLLAPAPPPVR